MTSEAAPATGMVERVRDALDAALGPVMARPERMEAALAARRVLTTRLARAAISAIREPTEAMIAAAFEHHATYLTTRAMTRRRGEERMTENEKMLLDRLWSVVELVHSTRGVQYVGKSVYEIPVNQFNRLKDLVAAIDRERDASVIVCAFARWLCK